MHYSTLTACAIIAVAAAAPTDFAATENSTILGRGTPSMQVHGVRPATIPADLQTRDLEKRYSSTDGTYCSRGNIWIPVADQDDTHLGFNSGIAAFCGVAANVPIPAGHEFAVSIGSLVTTVPEKGNPAHIDFSILNGFHSPVGSISQDDCTTYLSHISSSSDKCYQQGNKDTRGGERYVASFGWFRAQKLEGGLQ
ncbi:hypothetical protein MMC06_003820 [Schaereria dolodes]|nr:hypothetical protein [Schaereria dolodes]